MTLWEYRVECISTEQIANQLNYIGSEGWEFACILPQETMQEKQNDPGDTDDLIQIIFKRPKKSV